MTVLLAIIGAFSSVIGIVVAYFELKDRFVLNNKKKMAKIKGVGNLDRAPDLIFSFFKSGLYKKISMKVAFKRAKELAIEIEEYKPTIIIGIGRGGAIFGSLISYNLFHIPIEVIDRAYDWKTEKRIDKILHDFNIPNYLTKRVLLVAGEAHTGGTMNLFYDALKQKGAEEIEKCVFYKQSICTQKIKFVGIERSGVPLMPWQDANYIRDSLNKDNAERLITEQKELYSGKKITAYIVRHAETNENADGDRFIGTTDAQLSEKGKEQAIKVGKFLSDKNIDIIYSSPQKRCFDTAFFIQKEIGGDAIIKQSQLLEEMNYGDWENIKRNDVEKQYPEMYQKYVENPYINFPFNAENPKNVVSRIKQFWKEIISKLKENSNIVIVTHKTTGRLMICDLTSDSFSSFRNIKLTNASITTVLLNGDYKEIKSFKEVNIDF